METTSIVQINNILIKFFRFPCKMHIKTEELPLDLRTDTMQKRRRHNHFFYYVNRERRKVQRKKYFGAITGRVISAAFIESMLLSMLAANPNRHIYYISYLWWLNAKEIHVKKLNAAFLPSGVTHIHSLTHTQMGERKKIIRNRFVQPQKYASKC